MKNSKIKEIEILKKKVMNLTRNTSVKLLNRYTIIKLLISLIFAISLRSIIVLYFDVDKIEDYILAISAFLLTFTYENLYTKIFISKGLHDLLFGFFSKLKNKQYIGNISNIANFMEGESSKSQPSELNKPSSSGGPSNPEKYIMLSTDISNSEIEKHCPELHKKLMDENKKGFDALKNIKDETEKFLNKYRDNLSTTSDNLFKDVKYPTQQRALDIYKKSENFQFRKLNSFLDFVGKDKQMSASADLKKIDLIYNSAKPNVRGSLEKRLIDIKYNNAMRIINREKNILTDSQSNIKKIYQEAYWKIKEIKGKEK